MRKKQPQEVVNGKLNSAIANAHDSQDHSHHHIQLLQSNPETPLEFRNKRKELNQSKCVIKDSERDFLNKAVGRTDLVQGEI